MEEQNQPQPAEQPEKSKKKFYKKWWFWVIVVVIIFFAIVISLYPAGWLGFAQRFFINPCSNGNGWKNTPCLDSQGGVSDEIVTALGNAGIVDQCVIAWDTSRGVIYFSSVYGTHNESFIDKQGSSQNCGGFAFSQANAPIGTFYNSDGDEIATCNEWNDPKICLWLTDLDADEVKYNSHCC